MKAGSVFSPFDTLSLSEAREYHKQEADHIQKELDNLGPEFAEDGIVKTVLRDRIVQEKQQVMVYSAAGPGSITCDRAGPVTIEDCKTCWGTGSCRYGKTEEEWDLLVKNMEEESDLLKRENIDKTE